MAKERNLAVSSSSRDGSSSNSPTVIQVWDYNVEGEFRQMIEVIERMRYVSVYIAFPGIVALPMNTVTEHCYQTVRANVDLVKFIQIGFCFADADGRIDSSVPIWQYNFNFDPCLDNAVKTALHVMQNSGVNFATHKLNGINAITFGELLSSSGLLMNESLQWITYHSSYHLAFLMKAASNANSPISETSFYNHVKKYFPTFIDVKYVVNAETATQQLQGMSPFQMLEKLGVKYPGVPNQAGNDAHAIMLLYFAICTKHLPDSSTRSALRGHIYGLRTAIQ